LHAGSEGGEKGGAPAPRAPPPPPEPVRVRGRDRARPAPTAAAGEHARERHHRRDPRPPPARHGWALYNPSATLSNPRASNVSRALHVLRTEVTRPTQDCVLGRRGTASMNHLMAPTTAMPRPAELARQ